MKPEAGKYTGRSVVVTEYTPLQAALGRMNRVLNQNKVRTELRLIERYEKPTDKRRRLKSERHRRRFAEMVSDWPHLGLEGTPPLFTSFDVFLIAILTSFSP